MELDDEYKKLIMNAFILTTVHLLGFALVGLVYLNYVIVGRNINLDRYCLVPI